MNEYTLKIMSIIETISNQMVQQTEVMLKMSKKIEDLEKKTRVSRDMRVNLVT